MAGLCPIAFSKVNEWFKRVADIGFEYKQV
jgi:hypothetical protein